MVASTGDCPLCRGWRTLRHHCHRAPEALDFAVHERVQKILRSVAAGTENGEARDGWVINKSNTFLTERLGLQQRR